MGFCLQAVASFFEGQKNFEGIVIYLKLAMKLFVCIGVEGVSSILGDRSMSEFVMYFLIKSFDSQKLSKRQLAMFLDIYLEAIKELTRNINTPQQDTEIIQQAFDIFALFIPQLRG